jgi:hypothetical protein
VTEQNPFDYLDFTLEEALRVDAELISRRPRDGRICACGHPMMRHTITSGIVYCKPTRMDCMCKNAKPVIDSNDTRPFLRKTEGAGALHALGRGMASALKKGITFKWIDTPVCERCKTEGPVSPVPVTSNGVPMSHQTGYDVLLCMKCRQEI